MMSVIIQSYNFTSVDDFAADDVAVGDIRNVSKIWHQNPIRRFASTNIVNMHGASI
jgi:hypothetical protein